VQAVPQGLAAIDTRAPKATDAGVAAAIGASQKSPPLACISSRETLLLQLT